MEKLGFFKWKYHLGHIILGVLFTFEYQEPEIQQIISIKLFLLPTKAV